MKQLLTSLTVLSLTTTYITDAACIATSNEKKEMEDCNEVNKVNKDKKIAERKCNEKKHCQWIGAEWVSLQSAATDFWVEIMDASASKKTALSTNPLTKNKLFSSKDVRNVEKTMDHEAKRKLLEAYDSECDYLQYNAKDQIFDCIQETFHRKKEPERKLTLELEDKKKNPDNIRYPFVMIATLKEHKKEKKGYKAVASLAVKVMIGPIDDRVQPLIFILPTKNPKEAEKMYFDYKRSVIANTFDRKGNEEMFRFINMAYLLNHLDVKYLDSPQTVNFINNAQKYNGLILFSKDVDKKYFIEQPYLSIHLRNIQFWFYQKGLKTLPTEWELDKKTYLKHMKDLQIKQDVIVPMSAIQIIGESQGFGKQPYELPWKFKERIAFKTKKKENIITDEYKATKYVLDKHEDIELYMIGVHHGLPELLTELKAQLDAINPDVIILEYDAHRWMHSIEKMAKKLSDYAVNHNTEKVKWAYDKMMGGSEFFIPYDKYKYDLSKLVILADLPFKYDQYLLLSHNEDVTNPSLYRGVMTNTRNHLMAGIVNKAVLEYGIDLKRNKKKYVLIVGNAHTGFSKNAGLDWEYANGLSLNSLFTKEYKKMEPALTKTKHNQYEIHLELYPFLIDTSRGAKARNELSNIYDSSHLYQADSSDSSYLAEYYHHGGYEYEYLHSVSSNNDVWILMIVNCFLFAFILVILCCVFVVISWSLGYIVGSRASKKRNTNYV